MTAFLVACALLGGGLLAVQLVLTFVGADHATGHDGSDLHARAPGFLPQFSEGLDLLSVRAISAGVTFLGLGVRIGVALGALATPAQVSSQVRPNETNSLAIRQECQRVRTAVGSRVSAWPDSVTRANLLELGRCQVTAGEVLPQLWRATEADSGALKALIDASRNVHDARIFDAVVAIAADRNSPSLRRQAALIAAAGYVNPQIGGEIGQTGVRTEPVVVNLRYSLSTRRSDSGTVVPPSNTKERLLGLLSDIIAEHEAPPQRNMYWLAQLVRSRLDSPGAR